MEVEWVLALHVLLDDVVGRDRIVGTRFSVPKSAVRVVAHPEIGAGRGRIDLDRGPASCHEMERIIADQCPRRSDSRSASRSIRSSARSRSCATRGGGPMISESTASGSGTISFLSPAPPTEIN